MLVHGDSDKRIPIKNAMQNFKKIKKGKFLKIKNANHSNVNQKGGEEYFEKVKEFLNDIDGF